jgi:beta-glucosidase
VALLRQAATDATVLLSNDGTLPLDPESLTRVAVIGAHASSPRIMGGGSAQVVAYPYLNPIETLTAQLGDQVEVTYERGCEVDRAATVIGPSVLRAPDGFRADVYANTEFAGAVVETRHLDDLRILVLAGVDQGWPKEDWSIRVSGTMVPDEDGIFELALAQSGRSRLFVGGELVLDGFADPPPPGGTDFFGLASSDLVYKTALVKGVPVAMVVEYARIEAPLAGFRVGFRTADHDRLLDRAVAVAAAADVALLFVGTTEEWETEGRDRASLDLPGLQTELIRRVAAVNEHVVVVVNAAAPVDLSWADEVSAVLQSWFGGQEMAGALADILTGRSEPGGRLATTIPERLEHSPSQDNFPGENGELRYGEGIFMGYRGYEHRAITPRFAFGHGLSYTTFSIGEPTLSAGTFRSGETLTVSIPVTNTGNRAGTEVVQCYVAPNSPRLVRPPKELKGFAKVRLDPGETESIDITLDDRSFAYWDPGQADWDEISPKVFDMFGSNKQERRQPGWQIDTGSYDLLIGRSSADISVRRSVRVEPQQ